MTLPAASDQYNDRFSERVEIAQAGALERDGHEPVPITLVDLSAGGFKCECIGDVEIGETHVLNLGLAGAYDATVCWRLGNHVGGMFVKPLSWGKLFCLLSALHTGEKVVDFSESRPLL